MNAVGIDFTRMKAGLSRVTAQSLPDTCTIQRNTPASDGAGGYTDAWADLATGVACRLETFTAMRAGVEAEIAAKLTSLEPRIVVLPAGQDVTVKDRVVVTSQGSVTVEIKALMTPKSFELFREVIGEIVA